MDCLSISVVELSDVTHNIIKSFFDIFNLQVSSKFKQKPLDSIGKEFVEAGRALDCLNVDKARCFKAVVDSRRLVEWLRTTITCKQCDSLHQPAIH